MSKNRKSTLLSKQSEIQNIQKEMQDIEQLLQKTKIIALYEKKEEEWSLLNEKVKVLEADIDAINEGRDMIDKKNLLLKTQPIIQNPLLMRNNSNTEQKKLIVSVRFGDSLMRDKKKLTSNSRKANALQYIKRFTSQGYP